jgi:hypothetical protein
LQRFTSMPKVKRGGNSTITNIFQGPRTMPAPAHGARLRALLYSTTRLTSFSQLANSVTMKHDCKPCLQHLPRDACIPACPHACRSLNAAAVTGAVMSFPADKVTELLQLHALPCASASTAGNVTTH